MNFSQISDFILSRDNLSLSEKRSNLQIREFLTKTNTVHHENYKKFTKVFPMNIFLKHIINKLKKMRTAENVTLRS